MKKNFKLLIIKSLAIVTLLLVRIPAFAQHPLLGPDELNVYVLASPNSLVQLGKTTNDGGRTCYKWTGYFEEGAAERTGSYQAFLLPEYMANPGTSYTYILTVIGEQYYQQEVVLHVRDSITFQVQPKRGCISGNEMPQIEDFEITTDPPGYENLVQLVSMQPHTYNVNDGYYDVIFELRMGGFLMDQKAVTIVNTDDEAMNQVYNVPVDKILTLRNNIQAVMDVIKNGMEIVPGWYGSVGVDLPEPSFGNWTLTRGYDCCDEMKNQLRVDIDYIGVDAGVHVDGGFNLVVLKAFLRGEIGAGFGLNDVHFKVLKTCDVDPPTIDINLHSSVSVGAYVEDITGGSLLSAYARFVCEMKKSYLKLGFIETDYALVNGSLSTTVYFEAQYTLLSLFEKSCEVTIVPEKVFYVNAPIKLK